MTSSTNWRVMNQEAIDARRRDLLNQLGPLRRQHLETTKTIERLEGELETLQGKEGRWDVS